MTSPWLGKAIAKRKQMAKAVIVGAGSIGLRHAKLLQARGLDVEMISKRLDLEFKTYKDLEPVLAAESPELIVIANQTSLHQETYKKIKELEYGGKVLIEKPLNFSNKNLVDSIRNPERIGVAFNLRFHPLIQRFLEILTAESPISMHVYAGQHLDLWRKPVSNSISYSKLAAAGGGSLRDLSHELDYIMLLGSKVTSLVSLGGKSGNVTIDSDDSWTIILETERIPQVSLQINYFDKPGSRTIRLVTETNTYFADLRTYQFEINGIAQNIQEKCPDYTYEKLHEDFLVGGGKSASLGESLVVDKLINKIEKSASSRMWIKL